MRIRPFILPILVATPFAGAVSLSGQVLDSDSLGMTGVVVSLSGSDLADTTDAQGSWSLGEVERISRHPSSSASGAEEGLLALESGHLRIRLQGRDLLGRRRATGSVAAELPEAGSASRTARDEATDPLPPDTLRYSFGDSVFLRDTISVPDTAGIVRVFDTTWNASIVYGYLTDARDGHVYRTVGLGSRIWMAENLNYRGATKSSDIAGVCPANKSDSCAKYGRLYTWVEALDTTSIYDTSFVLPNTPARGLCPQGWHLPSDQEWMLLESAVGMESSQLYVEGSRGHDIEGYELKATHYWEKTYDGGPGTDEYGFRILPAGYQVDGSDLEVGSIAIFWTMSESTSSNAWCRYFTDMGDVTRVAPPKTYALSLRCVED